MRYKRILLAFCFLLFTFWGIAQDVNLDSLLDTEMSKKSKSETQFTEATFKTSRIVNSHSVETTKKGVLDFKISHRFGAINNGFYDLFGLDDAIAIRLGAEYGLTNRLTVGGGRSSYQKEFDGFLKYRLLWQSTGKQYMPISLTLLSSLMLATDTDALKARPNPMGKSPTSDKFSYAFQALIARKFSSNFSLELMPTMVRNNFVSENLYSVGIGARLKLTKRSGIIGEYYYQFPGNKLPNTYNSLSLGYEIETGGHVFQFNISNSVGISERSFITETHEPWSFNTLHLGFNISRVFTLKRPKDIGDKINNDYPYAVTEPKKSIQDTGETRYAQAIFKTTRLINGHTVETTQQGVLDLKVTHRFGTLNSGFYNMFGLDVASMRIGVDYGINNRFTVGAGRSAGGLVNPSQKEYDGFLKYRLLQQSTGARAMPLSITLLSSMLVNTLKETREVQKVVGTDTLTENVKINTSDRFSYAFQALIARKFSESFSLQVAPTMVHHNIVDSSFMSNDIYAIGFGARIKLTKISSLNLEYYYQFPGHKLPGTYNSFSIGYEIETGGHVFQFHLTNSTGMNEPSFITDTKGRWSKGDIHIGFNISRVFVIGKPRDNVE